MKPKAKELGRPREIGADVPARIYELRAQGHGYKTIAQIVGASRTTDRGGQEAEGEARDSLTRELPGPY